MYAGLTICLWVLLLSGTSATSPWSHSHQEDWPDPFCQLGNQQSPIDLDPKSSLLFNPAKFTFDGYKQRLTNLRFGNNGHVAVIYIPAEIDLILDGGGLPTSYRLSQIHFHWSHDDRNGSEHSIMARHYHLEAQFIHVQLEPGPKRLNKVRTNHSGGTKYAVVATLFELDPILGRRAEPLKPLLPLFGMIARPDEETRIPELKIDKLLPNDRGTYYRYDGSLTMPDCSESVIWTVLAEPQRVSPAMMSGFRLLVDEGGLPLNNTREKQWLGERYVRIRCSAKGDCSEALTEIVTGGTAKGATHLLLTLTGYLGTAIVCRVVSGAALTIR